MSIIESVKRSGEMKISYAEYIKKTDASVLVAEAIFSELYLKYPIHKISEVAKTTSGGTPNRSNPEFYNGEIAWLKSGELNDGIIEKAEEFITELGLNNSSAKLLPKGTLLLAMYGATAGRTGITKIEASTNQAVCALFPNEKVLQEYLFWFLRQHRHKFIEISRGGAQPNISQSVVNNTEIPIPDKKLQGQIADILFKIENEKTLDIELVPIEFRDKVKTVLASKNNVFDIDSELTHQLDLVKKLRQQFLQEAVQGKLIKNGEWTIENGENTEGVEETRLGNFQSSPNVTPAADETGAQLLARIKAEKARLIKDKKIKQGNIQDAEVQEEILFEIPDNWVWCKLDDICKNITDGTHQTPQYVKNGRVFLSAQNIKPFKFMPDEHKFVSEEAYQEYIKNKKPEKGDILIARVGAGIGESAVINREMDFCFYVSLALVQPFKSYLNTDYLTLVLNSPYGVRYSKGNTSSKGGSAGNFNLGRIRSFLIPLPPLSMQAQIVAKVEELMGLCDALEASIQDSKGVNEALLQQVLREALAG